jgi:hypothetical protein
LALVATQVLEVLAALTVIQEPMEPLEPYPLLMELPLLTLVAAVVRVMEIRLLANQVVVVDRAVAVLAGLERLTPILLATLAQVRQELLILVAVVALAVEAGETLATVFLALVGQEL